MARGKWSLKRPVRRGGGLLCVQVPYAGLEVFLAAVGDFGFDGGLLGFEVVDVGYAVAAADCADVELDVVGFFAG